MIIFPGREKFHAWSVDEAARRAAAVSDATRVNARWASMNAWSFHDRQQLIMCLLQLMEEKCRILDCNASGLHIDLRPGSDGCQFRIVAGTWPEKP